MAAEGHQHRPVVEQVQEQRGDITVMATWAV